MIIWNSGNQAEAIHESLISRFSSHASCLLRRCLYFSPTARLRSIDPGTFWLRKTGKAVLAVLVTRKPDGTPSQWWDDRQKRKVDIGLAKIEAELADYTVPNTITPILVGCMCQFMDRVSPDDWRKAHPALAAWYESYRTEPHMASTEVND